MSKCYKDLHERLFSVRWLFNLSSDAVMVGAFDEFDGFERFIEANDCALKLLGYTRSELKKLTMRDILADDSFRELSCVEKRLSAEGQVMFEAICATRKGCELPVETEACLLKCSGKFIVIFFTAFMPNRIYEKASRAQMLKVLSNALGVEPCTYAYREEGLDQVVSEPGSPNCRCHSKMMPCKYMNGLTKRGERSLMLTVRESEVLDWISKGKKTGDISTLLNIKESTVRYHVNRILDKLNAFSRAHAVAIALQRGIL